MAEKSFDVFLAHNGSEKPAVIALAERLKEYGLRVWLDEWELRPGHPWNKAFKEIIQSTRSAVMLVGSDGISPWEDAKMRVCLAAFARHKRPVIPVLLPACPRPPDLPQLLKEFVWVDFRDNKEEEGFLRLIWGITGKKPEVLDAFETRRINWELDIPAEVTELHLANWKSFDVATLYFDPLSVLIGNNGGGKSNALDALQFLSRTASGLLLTAALQGDNSIQGLRGGTEWAARRPGNRFALGVKVRTDTFTDYDYRIECEIKGSSCQLVSEQLSRVKYGLDKDGRRTSSVDNTPLYWTESCDAESPSIIARINNDQSWLSSDEAENGIPRPISRTQSVLIQLAVQPMTQELFCAVTAVALSLRGAFILDPIPSHMRGYSPLSERLEPDARNIAGVLAAMPETKRKEIEDKLTHYVSQLPERDIRRVYAEPVGKFKSDAMLYCEEHWISEGDPPTVDARGMSDGTLRFLAVLTALLTRPPGSLLVIEEVDNGLHPSRARLLLEMLRTVGGERRVDVLVTTHNPALLDAMDMDLVPFITVAHRDFASGCSRLTLLEDLEQLPKLLAQGAVGRLSTQGLIEKALHSEDK